MASIGEIKGTLTLSTEEFDKALKRARDGMDRTGKSAHKTSKDIALIQQASLAMTTAVGAAFAASVAVAANFEQKMKDVEAVSGATGAEMEQLGNLAQEMGQKTAFSATEAAMGIEELIKAGLTVEQIINGGLDGALNLAIAGNLQLADAAEIASTALNAFRDDNLSVVDAANILAGAANASATNVSEMQYGLAQVSAVASGVGLSFQDTATALAAFAQNGLKGSDAGTSLKTMLQNLQPTTKDQIALFKNLGLMAADGTNAFYDLNGEIRGMDEIAGILQNALKDMTDQQRAFALETIFGSDAVRAGNILYKEGADGLNAMWDAMSKVTAADVAATKMDTLIGAFNEFTSSVETIGIRIGEDFLPILSQVVRQVTGVIQALDEADLANIKVALAFGGTAAAVALVGSSLVKLAGSVRLLFASMGPAGWLITGLSLLGGAIASTIMYQSELNEVNLESADTLIGQRDALKANIDAYDSLSAKSKLTNDELARFVDINSLLAQTVDPNIIARLKDEQEKLRQKSGLSNDELDRLVQLNGDILKVVPESSTVLTDQGNVLLNNTDKAKEFNAQQAEMIRLELEAQKAKAEANMDEYLRNEIELQKDINGLKKDKIAFDQEEREQLAKIEELRRQYAEAKESDDWTEQDRLQRTIEMEEGKLNSIRKQRAETAGLIVKKSEELAKVQEQIGKLDQVKRKMVELELKQVGINAKKGEEVKTLDTELVKLQLKKKKLEETTPSAQKNTDEYRRSVDAIQSQISKLETAKSRINDIISSAGVMNSELARSVNKSVVVKYSSTGRTEALPAYHTGGIVGRGQLPKLHTGGLAAELASLPNHNEVDARLLRNEMVLTEGQQANLMRMIDAGFTPRKSEAPTEGKTVTYDIDINARDVDFNEARLVRTLQRLEVLHGG